MPRTTLRLSETHCYNYNQESQGSVLCARNTHPLNCLQRSHREKEWRRNAPSVLLNSGAGTPTLFNFSSFVSQFNLELLKFDLCFVHCALLWPQCSEPQGSLSPTIPSSLLEEEEEEGEGGRVRKKICKTHQCQQRWGELQFGRCWNRI